MFFKISSPFWDFCHKPCGKCPLKEREKMKFVFIMQHAPTAAQVADARNMGFTQVAAFAALPENPIEGVEYLGLTPTLYVSEDLGLGRDWFVNQAQTLIQLAGVKSGDAVVAAGHAQLMNAVNAAAKAAGCDRYESVTARVVSEDIHGPDGSVKTVQVFRHLGFRPIFDF